MAKVLITGGTGFIGSHLAAGLVRDGHSVTAVSRSGSFVHPDLLSKHEQQQVELRIGNICDRHSLEDLVCDADVLFHKAAAVGVAESGRRVRDFMEINVLGTATLVDVLKTANHNLNTIVLGSSISVYGEGNYTCPNCGIVRPDVRTADPIFERSGDWNPRCPACQQHLTPTWTPENAERRGESIYAISKKTQEDLLVSTCRLMGIRLIILRYCTVFGPGQSSVNPYSRFLRLMLDGGSPTLTEDGLQSRDFIFVDDVVQANIRALRSALSGIHYFNVGSSVQTPLSAFVDIARAKLASISEREIAGGTISKQLVPGEIRHCQADCSKMTNELSVHPRIDLEEGIGRLAEWFLRARMLTS